MKRTNYQLKDYFIEFFIVLLGITIAFWLSNLGEEKKERQLEEVYLTDIANDLDKDIEDLTFAIYQNNKKYDQLIQGYKYYLEGGPKVSADSLVFYAQLIGNYFHFQPNNYTYISLQQSGDFKIIKDPGLKKSLIDSSVLSFQEFSLKRNYALPAECLNSSIRCLAKVMPPYQSRALEP